MNLGMLLEMVADAAGDRLVVGSRRDGLTAQELQVAARRVATLLRTRGVEYVGMVDLNSEAVPVALFGASLAGLPFAPINYRLTDDKLNSIVARLAPGIVVAGADIGGRLQPHDGIEVITTDELLATARDEIEPLCGRRFHRSARDDGDQGPEGDDQATEPDPHHHRVDHHFQGCC